MNFKYFIQIVVFSFIGLSIVGQLYLPIPVLNSLTLELNLKSVSPTWIISVFGYSYALGFLVFGPLGDRVGKRIILALGMILLIIFTILISNTNSHVILVRGMQGFFAASYPPLILAYIGQNFPDKIKGIAISAMSFAFLSAVIIAQLFIVHLANRSFISSQQVLTLLYLFGLLIIIFNIKADADNKSGNLLTTFYNLPKILFSREFFHYFIFTFAVLLLFVGFYLLLSTANSQFASNLFAVRLLSFPALLAAFIAPTLIKIKTTIWVLRLAFILQFIALLLASASFAINSYFVLILSSIIITLATALLVPCLIVLIGKKANANMRGTAISLYTFILFCGASSAPVIIDLLSNKTNTTNLFIAFSTIPMILIILLTLNTQRNYEK